MSKEHENCPTCICGRRAPVQGDGDVGTHRAGTLRMGAKGYGPGTISWAEHLLAWSTYTKLYPGQSAERMAERGGFGYSELMAYLGRFPETWEPR